MKVYDRFTDEYIDESEMEEIAPPERYVAITEEVLINNASRWFTEAFKQNDEGKRRMKNTYCTECPYFTDVVYEGEEWFGAKCKKDGHSTMPSMYAIKSLHDSCPLTAESEGEE